ncbi:3-oxoadipate enol-lactonase [Novosphingobium mangrovi (ex Hu et al. 2023)]|uniref:3-oxoadipate enol-lactonase n=1 Tax=Novosphingobium mangrovi (ex Hu et al. 2023) TaxID=2930094 RepID=A0ABT0ACH3_9SPHN|nr:3-oxoadipate enol-lactonase [Novosphingobium mangrovi (ex Hu et al. 2023)]MCJ1960895.1 3-oxoadipate enol-lactonase [Novosphingobium mangrovi (ex Hu et al. 2023)]
MPFSKVSGAQIYWKMDGREGAPVLVLLNSIGSDMDLWDPALAHLRDQFRLLRIDTRGHGASQAEPGDYTLSLLAEDILAVAREAGVDSFALAGVSLGGMIGMEIALSHPGVLEKLVLVCTSATMDAASWDQRIATVREKGMVAIAEMAMGRFLSPEFRAEEPAVYDVVLRQLIATDAQGYAGCGAAIRDMDLAGRISAIACPTLVVTGTRDTSTPLEGHGENLLQTIPGAQHLALEAAHLAPLEAPEALAAGMTSFLTN